MPEKETPSAQQEETINVLSEVIKKLTSQPLLYGTGILLILVMVASIASNFLSMLLWPTMIIFVVGLGAWLTIEITKIKKKSPSRKGIDIDAKNVLEGGSVKGIKNMPKSASASDVKIQADNIGGEVSGIEYADDKP